MGKEQSPRKTDTDLETLLARRTKLQTELAAVEEQISDLQSQGKKPSTPVEQVVEETKKGLAEAKPAEDLTKLPAEELLARKKTLSEQIDEVELNIRKVDRSIESTQKYINEEPFGDRSGRAKNEDSIKQLNQEKIALQDQLSVLKAAYSKVENAIKQNPQAQKIERIAALKNKIELCKSQIEFYKKEKVKNQHHLDQYADNPDTKRYFTKQIESADQTIANLSTNLEKLEQELAELE